jgi:hypothetical protein
VCVPGGRSSSGLSDTERNEEGLRSGLSSIRPRMMRGEEPFVASGLPAGYNDKMTSQNDHAHALRLLKALVTRGANSREPMAITWIKQVALEIGLEGDKLDSALDYAVDQGWFDDAEVRPTLSRLHLCLECLS